MAAIKENVGKDGKIISYRVRACVGRDGAGKQVWRSVTISIEQVEEEALKQGFLRLTPARQNKIINRLADAWETAEKEQFLRTPSARDKGRVTVKDFIEKTWIPIYVEDGKKSPNSVKFFKNTSKPIIDFMGGKRMNQVDAELCSRFVTYLNTVERERGGGPLSQTSRMHIFGTLRNILRTARRWKYIQTDPTEDMTRGERPSREKKPVAFLTESEAQQFLDALQEEPLKWRAYFTLLLMTGMRRGEAVALQWSDIDDGKDTGAPTITISKNAVMDKSQPTGRLIKQTKTGEIRAVPISEATLQMLRELKQETERNMEITLKPSAFVFCDEANPYLCMYPTSPTRRLEVIVKRHGLKKCSVHELRRTFATLALQAKVDPKTVAAITGHADTATLFKYYTGTDAEQKRKAVAGLEAALKNEKNE